MVSKTPKRNGYTFTELLIVTVIMAIVIFAGISGYRRFDQRQRVMQAAQQLVTELRVVQKMAGTGENAADCADGLESYRVIFGAPIRVEYVCNSGSDGLVKEFNLKNNIGVSATGDVVFNTLSQGVDSEVEIEVGPSGESLTVTVSRGGAISLD